MAPMSVCVCVQMCACFTIWILLGILGWRRSVLAKVVQGSRANPNQNQLWVCGHREKEKQIDFKELARVILGAGKSEICMAGWKFRRNWCLWS